LQIKLIGPPGNPTGVGASVRLRAAGQWGPAREIRAGAGYWSQDSSRIVLASPAKCEALEIRWPGGRINVVPVATGAKVVEVPIDHLTSP
jgi:hypothetical protein